MSVKKGQNGDPNSFQVFVDEHSPEEAIEVDRLWKKKLAEQKNKRYTMIMIGAVVVMIVIFAFLMSFIDSSSPPKHFEIQEVTYMETRYTYLQSSIPHLKFLVPFQDTKEIKNLRTLGIVFPEILAWIDSNVRPNSKVLFVPNEGSMVNVLGIALGYYLKGSLGGRLTIAAERIKYVQMSQKNIELMNIGLEAPMPIEVVLQNELKLGDYDLIVLENSNFHKKLPSTTNATILIIRKENAETSIMASIFLGHQKLQILKGKTTAQIRALPSQYGYSLVPYVPSVKTDVNYILLLPDSVEGVQLCEEPNSELAQKPWVRNLVQRLKNQTFTDTSILYAIDSAAGLQIISKLSGSKIYALTSASNIPNVIPIKTVSEFTRSTNNILIASAETALTQYLGAEDTLYVEIRNEQERSQLESKFKGHISVVSPYNNKGCFYPPALIDITPQAPFFLRVKFKAPKN